jgi:hypothetical protein
MLNWALTIYREFIDVLGLLTEACMVTGRYQGNVPARDSSRSDADKYDQRQI